MDTALSQYLPLVTMGLIPIVSCAILYFFDIRYLTKIPSEIKQIIYGTVFGSIAIVATEFGVKIAGVTMNVRDAAPLIAGLVFGGRAGVIAGMIGGIERFFAASWGAGTFTQIACSVGTMIAGVFGALLKDKVFDGHMPKSVYGFAAGIVVEVIHMLMVITTNFDDLPQAFSVVRVCTYPMVFGVALTTYVGLGVARVIKKHYDQYKVKNKVVEISVLFQRRILMVILLSFVISNTFNVIIQSHLSTAQTTYLLNQTLEDTHQKLRHSIEQASVDNAYSIKKFIEFEGDINNELLKEAAEKFDIVEINIINKDGIITYSNNEDYIGFDMDSGEQSRAFLTLLTGWDSYYTQTYGPTTYDKNVYRKYTGVVYKNGFVQVGYDPDQYYDICYKYLQTLANDKHVSLSGFVIVATETGQIVSEYNPDYQSEKLSDIGIDFDLSKLKENTLYRTYIYGEDSFYSFFYDQGFVVFATQTVDESTYTQTMSSYLVTFVDIIIYAVIFVLIFFTVRYSVVENVALVNASLSKIVAGDLDEVVNVRTNNEFDMLSNGINATVDRLKQLIDEANNRMQAELEYAAEIQRGSLPSTFPAFPSKTSFDIYASMDPAKEVGGDFYDFYLIDDHHLAILVADVSGKGIPASLFMMKSKAIIKSYAENGITVNDIFTNANYNLCEGNEQGLFVTAWMAIVDLTTGHVQYANAGHNPPLIKHGDGTYEYLRSKPGFILGGMEGIAYKLNEMDLDEGDEIFIYTDGLTEAQDIDKKLYGEDRLLQAVNNHEFVSSEEFCKFVKHEVDTYVGEAEQFDDLTMLHFKFKNREN